MLPTPSLARPATPAPASGAASAGLQRSRSAPRRAGEASIFDWDARFRSDAVMVLCGGRVAAQRAVPANSGGGSVDLF